MGKTTTRRSVSIRGLTYQRLKNYCEPRGLAISGCLEKIIAKSMEKVGEPVPMAVDPKQPRVEKAQAQAEAEVVVEPRVAAQASNHFTF